MRSGKTPLFTFLLLISLVISLSSLAAAQVNPPATATPAASPTVTPPAPVPVTPSATKPAAEAGPKSAEGAPLIDIDMQQVPLPDVLAEFSVQTEQAVSPRGKSAEKMVSITGTGLTPEQFLDNLANANQLVWRKTRDGYEVWDEESYKKEVLPSLVEQKIFVPEHIKAREFSESIKKSNILTPEIGGAQVDERTNQVIVADLPEKLALVQDLLNLIDVPQYTRPFYIRYADMDEVVKKIQDMQLKSEAGSIEVDRPGHLIIVRDTLPNIQRMESLISLLDVRQPERVYRLNSIGTEDEELKAIEDNLKLILTQDAYYYIDAVRGYMLVRDIPEVHKQVERFLKVFNSPAPQVHIQAELLEVTQNVNLNYGLEATFSEDLPAAVKDGLVGNFTNTGTSPDSPFGFINFREEFPVVSSGTGGFSLRYLSEHAKLELKAALTDINTRLLLRPNLTVINRKTGTMNVVTNEPIATVIPLGENTNQFSVSQSSVPSGLTLEFTPTITPSGLVTIELDITNSTSERIELATGLVSGISTITGVRTNEDSAQTTMIVPDGETWVISGLIRQTNADSVTGVPLLVKIPWIGPLLFGSRTNINRQRNLLFFITPTIIKEDVPDFAPMDFAAAEFEGKELIASRTSATDGVSIAEGNLSDSLVGDKGDLPLVGSVEERRFDAPLPGEARVKADEMDVLPSTTTVPNTQAGMEELLGTKSSDQTMEEMEEPEKVEEYSSYKPLRAPPSEDAAPAPGGPPQQPPSMPGGAPSMPGGGMMPPPTMPVSPAPTPGAASTPAPANTAPTDPAASAQERRNFLGPSRSR